MLPTSIQNNYPTGNEADTDAGFGLLFADDSLLVLNKPSGLLSVPGRGEDKQDCLSTRVQRVYPDALIVHRLDQATSGLLLMARGAAMQRALSGLFESRAVQKSYVTVVHGRLEGVGEIDLPILVDWPRRPLRVIDTLNGKPSQTRWQALHVDPAANTTRVMLEPVTGRSHQLRVHLQALGHPILGDTLYAPEAVQAMAPRLLLHACSLAFRHPLHSAELHFQNDADF